MGLKLELESFDGGCNWLILPIPRVGCMCNLSYMCLYNVPKLLKVLSTLKNH